MAEVTRGRAFVQKRAEAATWMRKSEVEDGHFWRFQVLTNEGNPNPNPGFPPALALKVFNSLVEDGLLIPASGLADAFLINAAKEAEWKAVEQPRWTPIKVTAKSLIIFVLGAIAGAAIGVPVTKWLGG